jgi:hypothetical protein
MTRLADYFVIVGYDHDQERKYTPQKRCKNLILILIFILQEMEHVMAKSFKGFLNGTGPTHHSSRESNG